jgi:hypothetical protein
MIGYVPNSYCLMTRSAFGQIVFGQTAVEQTPSILQQFVEASLETIQLQVTLPA